MPSTLEAAPDTAAFTAAALQRVLPELVALSLDAKQAHWNVTGARFLALHELTDRIAATSGRTASRSCSRGWSWTAPTPRSPIPPSRSAR